MSKEEDDQTVLEHLISKLYDFMLIDQPIRLYISDTARRKMLPPTKRFRVTLAPVKEGTFLKYADTDRMTVFFADNAPFIGTKDLSAKQAIQIIHRMFTGQENEDDHFRWIGPDR